MSDLREAIKDAVGRGLSGIEGDEDAKPLDRATDAVLAVFEAYLREHDAQARQRIEDLTYYGPHMAAGLLLARDDVLEALGGSDE